jgi:hypothetical protein
MGGLVGWEMAKGTTFFLNTPTVTVLRPPGVPFSFFTDIHGGVGWLGDGERYYFSFHFFFVPRTHFLVQNLVNFGGNFFAGNRKGVRRM